MVASDTAKARKDVKVSIQDDEIFLEYFQF